MTPKAFAIPSCPSSKASDFVSEAWYPTDAVVAGIRAPVQLRTDGTVCSGGPEPGFAATYVAINNTAGSEIDQIGFIHVYDSSLGAGKYCRFWAIDGGGAHAYLCAHDSNDTYVYFQVIEFYDPDTRQNYYSAEDCGTVGGYDSCTSHNSSQQAFASAFAFVSAETDFGRAACTVKIMGSASDEENIGNSSYAVEGEHHIGDSWGTKTMIGSPGVCVDYSGEFSNTALDTWDTRNNQ